MQNCINNTYGPTPPTEPLVTQRKPRTTAKRNPSTAKKSCSPSSNIILDPEEQKTPRRKQVGIVSPTMQHTSMVATKKDHHLYQQQQQQQVSKKKASLKKPRDNDDHFIYDPLTSSKYLSRKFGRRILTPSTGPFSAREMLLWEVNSLPSPASIPASPRGRNITRSSIDNNILSWDPSIDVNRPIRKDTLRPSQLGMTTIHGFGSRV